MASTLVRCLDDVRAEAYEILVVTKWLLQLQTSYFCSRQEEGKGKESASSIPFLSKAETFPESPSDFCL